MNKQNLIKEIAKLEEHLSLLYSLENKKVAFYNREVWETQNQLYKLEQDLKQLNNEVSSD